MLRLAPLAALAILAVAAPPASAQQGDTLPETVLRSAERALQDDSLETVTTRWRSALERDSTDLAATLGLATVARQTYDFERADSLLNGLLARAGTRVDGWTVRARLGIYRVANSRGEVTRADSLLRLAMAEARRLDDRPAQIAALIGFTNTRSGDPAALYPTLDSVLKLLPPGDGRDRAEYLCRRGLYRGIRAERDASAMVRQGIAMAERVGERQLTGHCLEVEGLLQSLRTHDDSALATMDRAARLLRATHEHAGLARIASRRSDILQGYGRLGEAQVALEEVMAGARISRNRQRLANGYGGLGMLALRVGDLPTAAENFARAAALNDSLGQAEGSMIARQNTGEVLAASGDLPAARATFLHTLDLADRGRLFRGRRDQPAALARVAIRQGDWGEAERQLATADSAAHARGVEDMRNGIVYDRGRLALARGNAAGAARLFTAFLARTDSSDHLIRYTVRSRLAQAWAAAGDLRRAERELTDADRTLEGWRATLDAGQLRRYAYAATTLGEYDPQGPASSVIAALAGGGRTEAAFTLAERRRARTLADRLTQADALRETDAARDPGDAHRDRGATAAQIAAALPDDRTAILEYVAGTEGAPTTLFIVTRARRRGPPPAAGRLAGAPGRALRGAARERRECRRARQGPRRRRARPGGRGTAGRGKPADRGTGRPAPPGGIRRAPAPRRPAGGGALGDRPRAVGGRGDRAQARRSRHSEWRSRRAATARAGRPGVRQRARGRPHPRGRSLPRRVRRHRRAAAARRERRRGPRRGALRHSLGGAAPGRRQRSVAQADAGRPVRRHPPRHPRAGGRELACPHVACTGAGVGRGWLPLAGGPVRAQARRRRRRPLGVPHGGWGSGLG